MNQPFSNPKKKIGQALIWLDQKLLQPHSSIKEIALKEKSLLLSIFLLIFISIFAVGDTIYLLTDPSYMPPWYGYVFLVSSFMLNRAGRYNLAATLTVSMFPIVIFWLILDGNPLTTLYYLVLSIILASILLKKRFLILLVSVYSIGILLMVWLAPEMFPDISMVVSPLSTLLIGAALILVSMFHRDQIEKSRQRELSLSEERIQLALDAAKMGSWDWNTETGEVKWSPNVEPLFGLEPGTFEGTYEAYLNLVHEDDRETVLNEIERAISGEIQDYIVIHRINFPDRSVRWLEGKGKAYYGSDGKPHRMSGTVTDITERQQAEETMKLFQYTIDRARDAIQWLNREGGFEYVNEQACRSLGYTREELMRLNLWDIDPIYPKERWEENWESYQEDRQGGSETVETLHRRKDGSDFPVEVVSNHLWFGDRELHVAVVRDITERKQAEEALRESEQKFRLFVEQSSVGLVFTDEKGIIIEWNSAQENLTGITKEESIGQPLWEIQPKMLAAPSPSSEAIQRLKQLTELALQSGQADFLDIPMEVELFRRDGTKIYIEQIAFSIKTKQGYRLGSVNRDITQLKQAEVERENLIQELTDKNSELERFTYTVSHDLKAPLITIAGFIGYLEQAAVSGDIDRLRGDTQRIQNAVNKMERLLNELLELSRIGRLMNPPEPIPFEGLAREALVIVHGQLETRGVSFTLGPDLPVVYGDRQRLVEVLQNLIDNAAKFMGDQPNPHIEIGQRGEEDGMPIFYVKDNGIGIAPEYHERVFGLFDKLDAKSDGTGIGLAIVKRIVEFHGGSIWIESEAGNESTFYFTLPYSAEEPQDS